MIAVTFALPAESSGFVRLLQKRTTTRSSAGRMVRGELHGGQVVVLHTGVGEEAARRSLRAFLQTERSFRFLICAGFAGALDHVLQPDDLLLGANVSDPQLLARAEGALRKAGARSVQLASAALVVDTPEERSALHAQTGAVAVEMETSVIAEECARTGLPMLALRVVSDTPAQPMPAPAHVLFDLRQQRTSFTTLAGYLATHPQAIPRLLRFAQRISAARRRLTSALDLLLRELA